MILKKTVSPRVMLFLFNTLEVGGAEYQAYLLAQYLKEKKLFTPVFIGLFAGGALVQMCQTGGIQCRTLNLRHGNIVQAIKTLRQFNPILIQAYTLYANVFAGLFWRHTSASGFIWNQRDEGLLPAKKPKLFIMLLKYLIKKAVQQATLVIANSPGSAKYITQQGIPQKYITIIYNGIQLKIPAHSKIYWQKKIKLTAKPFVVAMIANLTRLKDHLGLLQAWREYLLLNPQINSKLLLIGRKEEMTPEIEQYIQENSLQSSVTIVGPVYDMSGVLSVIDMCVLASVSEGLSNVVLEAMAAGKIVAGYDIPGIALALGKANKQFLVRPKDYKQLAKVIATVAQHKNKLKPIGARNQKRIRDNFSIIAMQQASLAAIIKALASGGSQ